MAITLIPSDVIPEALAGYLAALTTTEAINWTSASNTIQPPSDGSTAYQGYVWCYSYAALPSQPRIAQGEMQVGVRLLLAKNEILAISAEAVGWARVLSDYLAATKTLAQMARLGADLSGTYQGVAVPANTCLKAMWEPFEVTLDFNQGDGYQVNAGAVAIVKTVGRVAVAV